MSDELGGKIMTKFVELRAKTQIYLIDDEKYIMKRKLNLKMKQPQKRINL